MAAEIEGPVEPTWALLRAVQSLTVRQRSPEAIVEVISAAGLRVCWAPHPGGQSSRVGRGLPVECASCGRLGRLVLEPVARVEHPGTACPVSSTVGGRS